MSPLHPCAHTVVSRILRHAQVQVGGVVTEPRTQLKYAIEVALPRTTRLLGVLEPFLERVVYEVSFMMSAQAQAAKHRSCS